jgi:hypothetical protein
MKDLYKAIDALNEISQAERDAMRAAAKADIAAVRAATTGKAPPPTKADMYKDVADFAKKQRAASKAAGYATKAEYDAAYQQNLDNLAKAGVNMDDVYAAANKMMSTEKGVDRLAKMGIQDNDDLISYAMAKAGIKDVTPDKYTATDYAITDIPEDELTFETEESLDERVTYNTLAKLSGIENPDKIYPGQKITLPGGGSYKVKRGDTLSGIAQDYRLGNIGQPKSGKLDDPTTKLPQISPKADAGKLDDPTTKLPQVVDKLGPDGQYDGDDLGNAPSAPTEPKNNRFADLFRDFMKKEPNIVNLPNTYELDPETNKYTLVTKPKQPSGLVKATSQLARAESVEMTEGRRLYELASQPLNEASRDKKINAIVNSLGEKPTLDEIYGKIAELEGMTSFFVNKSYLQRQYLGKVAERYGLPGMYTPSGSFVSTKKDDAGRYQSSAGGTMKAAEELASQGLVPGARVEKIQAAAARNKKVAGIGDNPDQAKMADRLDTLAKTAIEKNPSAQPSAADDELKILKKREEPKQDFSKQKDKPSVAPSSDTDVSTEPKPSKTAEPVTKGDTVDAPTDDDLAAIAGTQPATKPDVQPEPPKKDGGEITPADLDAIAGTAPADSGDDTSGETPVASVATGGNDGSDTDAPPADVPTATPASITTTKGPSRADVYRRDPRFWADLEAEKKKSDARIASKKSDDDLSMSKITKKSSSPSDPDIVKMFTGGLKNFTGK